MISVQEIFQPLMGLPVWHVRRGNGSFLTFEFGNPRLEIREPRIVSADVSERVRRSLQKRRVFVVGQWHLWIQYCDWDVITSSASVSSDESDMSKIDACLDDIDGQMLVEVNASGATCNLVFDLGGKVVLRPSSEFDDDDQWTLHEAGQCIYAFQSDGTIIASPSESP